MCWYIFPNPRYLTLSKPWLTVLTFGTSKHVQFLRLHCFWCLSVNISFMIVGEIPWYILYISVARALRFLSWTETELSVSSDSSKKDFLSFYIKRRHFSWSLFILLFFVRLWHIQTNWQKLNWDMENAFNNNFFLFKSIYGGYSCWSVQFKTCYFASVINVSVKGKF